MYTKALRVFAFNILLAAAEPEDILAKAAMPTTAVV